MKRHFVISSPARLLSGALLLASSAAFAGEVALQKAPPLTVSQAPDYPENLARYHFGATVTAGPQTTAPLRLSANVVDQNLSEKALLCDDPTIGYQLVTGTPSISVGLPNIENVESVSFVNEGATGAFRVFASNADVPASSPEWKQVASGPMSSGAISVKFGPGEAKYVRLAFDITQPGRIASFGIYATPALSDFTMPRPRKASFEENSPGFSLINFNYSDVHARARGLYVSSGDLRAVNNMLDDQPGTVYQFASGDSAPTTVIDLGRERKLSRLSALYASQPGSIDFYVLQALPAANEVANESHIQPIANVAPSAELSTNLTVSEAALADLKPVGSVISTGEGRASVDFPETSGRYVMLKWHPAGGDAFSIAQVAAFGPANRASSSTADVEDGNAPDGKEAFDGKSILDNKDIPAEGEAEAPAEGPPPSLPNVPPFTFIPQVPPVSP